MYKSRLFWFFSPLVLFIVLHLILSFFNVKWSFIDRGLYLNVRNGEVKRTFECFGFSIWSVYEESKLIKYVDEENLNGIEGEWRTVSKVPWLVSGYSPTYVYQDSISQIGYLAELWAAYDHSEYFREESTETILLLLQNDAPGAVDMYIESLRALGEGANPEEVDEFNSYWRPVS